MEYTLSDYDIYSKGKKVGEIRSPRGNAFVAILGVILLMAIISICVQCGENKIFENQSHPATFSFDQISEYVVNYSSNINLQDERSLISQKYPNLKFDSWHISLGKRANMRAYDSSIGYCGKGYLVDRTLYPTRSNDAVLFGYIIDGVLLEFNCTVFLEDDTVESWLRADNPEPGSTSGFCVIFADNQIVYESPVLSPDGTLSHQATINLENVNEISVLLVGDACFTGFFRK